MNVIILFIIGELRGRTRNNNSTILCLFEKKPLQRIHLARSLGKSENGTGQDYIWKRQWLNQKQFCYSVMIYQIANMINNSYFIFQSQKTHSIPLTYFTGFNF